MTIIMIRRQKFQMTQIDNVISIAIDNGRWAITTGDGTTYYVLSNYTCFIVSGGE